MNPILLQKQLKENAGDLQDFYKDLQSWGEEMKRKEDSLKNGGKSLKKSKIQPSDAVKERIKEIPKAPPKAKVSKIGSTDYAKWDKFDAELECVRLEDDIKEDSELTDEFEDSIRDEALVHKEKGNSYVKAKEWDKAIESYTKAINCYSYDPIFYANRALCHLKKQSFGAAEEDCTLSLKLDGTYVKALQRRAAARESLGKLELAKDDLINVLTHEPKNKESLAALEKITNKTGSKEQEIHDQQRPVSKFTASRNKIQSFKPIFSTTTKTEITQKTILDASKIDTSGPSTSSWPDPGCDIIPVKSIDKPPHLRSKKPLKRIQITEVDTFLNASENIQVENNAVKRHVVENVKKVTFPESDKDAGEPVELISAFKKKRDPVKNVNDENISKEAWPKPNLQTENIICDDLKVLENVVENTPKAVKNTENISITKIVVNNVAIDGKSENETMKESDNEFSAPKTSVQFYATWKKLRTTKDRYKYLRLIDPNEIPNVFQESLESTLFSDILDVLAVEFIENKENIFNYLCGLTKVRRFSALTMFMDSKDKKWLWKMIDYLREQENITKENVDELILKYEL